MTVFNPWSWRHPALLAGGYSDAHDERLGDEVTGAVDEPAAADLTGYDVEATDGGIGSIDGATYEVGSAYLVVDTGPWIFNRRVLLPAGTVERIDHSERKVYVDRSKDQIKNSPEYDPETFDKPEYRDRVGSYYENSYRITPTS